MHLFNQFSYPLAVTFIGIILFFGLTRIPQINLIVRVVAMVVYVGGAVFLATQLRYPDSPVEVATVTDVENTLTNGSVTFLMLYSNY